MPDLSADIFDGEFDVTVSYATTLGGVGTDVSAIFSQGMDPGRESGKGLTASTRGIQAKFSRIILKQSEVATAPPIHSTVVYGGDTWDILSAQDTGAGTWRCEAKCNVDHKRRK